MTTLSGTEVPRILVGTYLKLDNEYLLVTQSFVSAGEWHISVNRGQRASSATAHKAGKLVQVLVSHPSGSQGLRFRFLSSFSRITPEFALVSNSSAFGGPIIEVQGHGLNATFLSALYTLPANYSSNETYGVSRESPSQAGRYYGHMFDVVASTLAIRLSSVEFISQIEGQQHVWVYARSCSNNMDCSYKGAETSLHEWTLHANVTVTNRSSMIILNATKSLVVLGGKRKGVAVFSDKGISLTQDPSYAPSDLFCAVEPGVIVEGTLANNGASFSSFILPEVDGSNSSFVFPGKIQYMTETVEGDTYRCQFRSMFRDTVVLSSPTRAFAVSPASLRQANTILCLVPSWRYGETNTTFSIVSEAGLELKKDADAGVQYFAMSASWNSMIGPTLGMGEGGTLLTISGTGFNVDGDITYECTFRSVDGFTASSKMVVEDTSRGVCKTPRWRHKHTMTQVDIFRTQGAFVGEAVPWMNSSITEIYSVGTPGGKICSGETCLLEGCLEYPCESRKNVVSTDYAQRTFKFQEMIGAPAEPSRGPATGGTRVTIPGLGINPNALYLCVFQKDFLALHVNASHLLNSSADVVCDTPTGNAFSTSNNRGTAIRSAVREHAISHRYSQSIRQ